MCLCMYVHMCECTNSFMYSCNKLLHNYVCVCHLILCMYVRKYV